MPSPLFVDVCKSVYSGLVECILHLRWYFEESTIALPSHYVHASSYVHEELRCCADAGRWPAWNGLCVVHQHVKEGTFDRPSASYGHKADTDLQQTS